MNNAGWAKFHALAPESVVNAGLYFSGKDEASVELGVFGIHEKYNNGAWTKVRASGTELTGAGNLDWN